MSTIVICSSANFYRQAVEAKSQLESLGFTVIVPATALRMEASGDYDASNYKTWYGNADDYPKKAELMRGHFDQIAREDCDAVLILNYEKNGRENYIGPNVLMEMGLAFYLRKLIFILNEIPEDSPFEEELKGFMPTVLHGKLEDLRIDS